MGTFDRQRGYRSPIACKVAGISYRQLDYWASTGLITPSIIDANGSGTLRRWSIDDIARLRIIRLLLDAGVSLRRIRGMLVHYPDPGDFDDFGGFLVTDGVNMWGADASGVVAAVTIGTRPLIVVNVDGTLVDVAADLEDAL